MNRDDCNFVDTWLDDWLAGRLSDEAAQRVEQHVSACGRCRRLAALLHEVDTESEGVPEADLLSGVLERTTGSPCARAEELMPALADGALDDVNRELVQAHAGHCDRCARLIAVLEESRQVLPSLADIEPPLGFTARVLARTSRAPRQSSLADLWQRILARPRASLEIAYAATVLLVIVFGNPVSAFNEARGKAGELVGAVPIARLTEPAAQGALSTVGRWLGGVTAAASAVADAVAARWRDVQALLTGIEQAIGGVIDWMRTGQWKQLIAPAHAPPKPQPSPQK